MDDTQRQAAWLSLHKIPGLGPQHIGQLYQHFGGIEAVFAARRRELQQRLPDQADAVDAILGGPAAMDLEAEDTWLSQPDCDLLTFDDADYPPLLREIPGPPPVLFLRGDRRLLGQVQLAIVGSRNPTPLGRQTAEQFAQLLAATGLVITSGLALGIDAGAHRGALAAHGRSIAVTATGLDRVYPPQHRELAHSLATEGLLVSELPLGSPPRREHFPLRNRIISGLSIGTLVVEAAQRSGSLITARLAVEQGREVFAIPGSIHSPLSRGCHQLLRQGAKLVETAEDILEELAPLAQFTMMEMAQIESNSPKLLSTDQRQLLQHMGFDPVTVDSLVERSGLTSDNISSMLLQMELAGAIAMASGGRYQRLN